MSDLLKRLFRQAFPNQSHSGQPQPAPGSAEETLRQADNLLLPVSAAYRRRLGQCGPTPKGAFWVSQQTVIQRFDILTRAFDPIDIAHGGVTIRDFGCGYGALFDYLQAKPIMNHSRYIGYDITQSMLDACAQRIKDSRASFRHSAKPGTAADYTLVSGTFNLKLDADDEDWLSYVEASLVLLWETTTKTMAFNMLDRRQFDPTMSGLYYSDHERMLAFCLEALSPKVEIIENYGLPDFTVIVRRF